MRSILLAMVLLGGCGVGATDPGTGDDDTGPDQGVCSLPDSTDDAGDLAALKADQCNQDGSQGQLKFYRLAATLTGSMDVVQLELWDGAGAFTGGAVHTGTFEIAGPELDFNTCGVCLRALGDKGQPTQKEYFATSGTVEVTAVGGDGQPISATITNATFAEVDSTTRAAVADGCAASIARVQVAGTVTGQGGGGGGGGGGGNNGGGKCPAGIGD